MNQTGVASTGCRLQALRNLSFKFSQAEPVSEGDNLAKQVDDLGDVHGDAGEEWNLKSCVATGLAAP